MDHVVVNGLEYKRRDGQPFEIVDFMSVRIDPRGHFTALRYAAIVVLDQIMKRFGIDKPLVEFCEFLADYPTW